MNFFKVRKYIYAPAVFISLIFGCAQGGFAPAPPLFFLYATDNASPGVYGFSINSSNGALTSLTGSPFPANTSPIGMAADPLARFLYATDTAAPGVYAYTINSANGALTQVSGSPFSANTSPVSICVESTGHFVYVVDTGAPGVYAYAINSSTGALTPVAGSPFAIAGPNRITTDHAGHFIFVSATAGIYAYTISSQTGALTAAPGSPFATSTASRGMAVDPTNSFLYDADWGGSPGIYSFSIQSSGALTAIAGSPFAYGNHPAQQIAITGSFLYLWGGAPNGVNGYTINPLTGALTEVSGSPFLYSTANTYGIVADPTGQFIYGVSNSGSFGIYGGVINQGTGSLTEIGSSPLISINPFLLTTVEIPQPYP